MLVIPNGASCPLVGLTCSHGASAEGTMVKFTVPQAPLSSWKLFDPLETFTSARLVLSEGVHAVVGVAVGVEVEVGVFVGTAVVGTGDGEGEAAPVGVLLAPTEGDTLGTPPPAPPDGDGEGPPPLSLGVALGEAPPCDGEAPGAPATVEAEGLGERSSAVTACTTFSRFERVSAIGLSGSSRSARRKPAASPSPANVFRK
jgi:hypothetical protein